MRGYIKRDDVILLAIELEFGRVVAFIAIKDQQPIFALRLRRYIAIEVLNPIQAYYISSLAVIGGYDILVSRKVALGVLVSEVVLHG